MPLITFAFIPVFSGVKIFEADDGERLILRSGDIGYSEKIIKQDGQEYEAKELRKHALILVTRVKKLSPESKSEVQKER